MTMMMMVWNVEDFYPIVLCMCVANDDDGCHHPVHAYMYDIHYTVCISVCSGAHICLHNRP